MRHKDTKAVTITLPRTLFDAVNQLADRDHCGNISAVIRTSLYKDAGVGTTLELKENGAASKIQEAESRTIKYSRRRKKH